jgi:hypothetical protein
MRSPTKLALERFPIPWNLKAALSLCFVAISRREPTSGSLEIALAAAFLSISFAAPALSQSEAEYQQACQDDALRLCSEHVPDHAKIKSCLLAHKKAISPACRSLVSPGKQKRQRQG